MAARWRSAARDSEKVAASPFASPPSGVGAGASNEFNAGAAPLAGTLPARPRVLLVDDNKDAADTLADALREEGCEVGVAYDGAEGPRRAAESPPDVALLDFGLPAMDGYELATRL